ncbi:MAG: NmrA family NAD(P)-binding protein [Burkholderiales bacterium]|nr:NmrA family NAD(P)-binding protein [Burkholderiales bacterium]
MIVILGAAGQTGTAALRRLKAMGVPARAMVSRAESEDKVRSAGASEVVIGNLRSAADVRRALAGASRVYHICPVMSDAEIPIGQNVIAAARAERVDHLVFHSLIHAQVDALLHHRDKRVVEGLIIESLVPYTFLQPTMYMQNMLWEWDNITGRGVYRAPYSAAARMSLIDLEDISAVAAKVLTEPGWDGGGFELCSGDNLTREEMAATIGQVLGKPVRAEAYSIDEWRPIGAKTRTPFQVERVATMYAHYDKHGLAGGNARVLAMMLGRTPTTYREFVARVARERGAI